MTTNEMTLAKAFREAGFEQHKAEDLAQIIFDAIRDNTATKADLREAVADLRNAVHDVITDLRGTEHRLTAAVHQLTIRGIGALVTAVGILFGLLHQWPPHG